MAIMLANKLYPAHVVITTIQRGWFAARNIHDHEALLNFVKFSRKKKLVYSKSECEDTYDKIVSKLPVHTGIEVILLIFFPF